MKTLILSVLFFSVHAQAVTFEADKGHTKVGFEIEHNAITTIDGEFSDYDFSYSFDNGAISNIVFTAKVDSINTGHPKRDEHLKGDDFFNVKKFPEIKFVSSKVEGSMNDTYKVKGRLTIKDMTKDFTFTAKCKGPIEDLFGGTKMGCKLSGSLDRYDYNLKWNKPLNKIKGLLVGKEVTLAIKVEATQKK